MYQRDCLIIYPIPITIISNNVSPRFMHLNIY